MIQPNTFLNTKLHGPTVPKSTDKNLTLADGRENHSESQPGLDILTRKELASRLRCSLRKIDHLQAQGLPVLRLGRSRRFILPEVIAWLRRVNR